MTWAMPTPVAAVTGPLRAQPGVARRERVAAIDIMRGAVMVLMLLDHVRDMVHVQAHDFSPTDPDRTSLALFFTRWVTHFCAPIFVLLAGVGIRMQAAAGMPPATLSRFLVTRGLWLVFLEFTAVRAGVFFSFDPHFLGFMQVIWVIGVSMVLLAALVRLPAPVVTAIGLGICVLHNLLDHVGPAPVAAGTATPWPVVLWMILHRFGQAFTSDGRMAFIVYPIIPWVGLMAAGYGLGAVFGWEAARRRRFLLRAGAAAVVAFVILRALGKWGGYGDPSPATPQPTAARALMSFLNVTKYPPSLDYLLMTCGPALLMLAVLEAAERTRAARWLAPLETLGRVPLFYYLLQWPYAHLAGLLLGALTGQSLTHFFRSPPDAFRLAHGFGFSLPVVYLVWVAGVLLLYLPCRAYARAKRRYRKWWMSYL